MPFNKRIYFLVILLSVFLFQNCEFSVDPQTKTLTQDKNNGGGYPGMVVEARKYAKPGDEIVLTVRGGQEPYTVTSSSNNVSITSSSANQFRVKVSEQANEGDVALEVTDNQGAKASWNLTITKVIVEKSTYGDGFGNLVRVYGDTLIVGASRDDADGFNSGAIYLLKRDGQRWFPFSKYTAPNFLSGYFGTSFDIDKDQVLVGVPSCLNTYDCSVASQLRAGHVEVYKRVGDSLELSETLLPPDSAIRDGFGVRLRISGDFLAIASKENPDQDSYDGAVYIFKRSGEKWSFQQKLTAVGADKEFGRKLVFDGDRLVIASGSSLKLQQGSFYYYKMNQQGSFDLISQEFPVSSLTQFSNGITIDGDLLYVLETGQTTARILTYSLGANFIRYDKTQVFSGDLIGIGHQRSLFAKDGVLAIGSPSDLVNGLESAGSVALFRKNESGFVFERKITMDAPRAWENFGNSVVIQGNEIFVSGSTKGIITIIGF